MITIPLFDVVAFLQRKGVDLACLEGAPMILPGGEMCVYAPHAMLVGDIIGLYLGRGPVCPAATGWAAALLGAAHGRLISGLLFDGDYLFGLGRHDRHDGPMTWHAPRMVRAPAVGDEIPSFAATIPCTPAERLRAVLLHEMGRA